MGELSPWPMPVDVSTATRIASLIATSPPEMRNDSFRGICRWVNTTLSIGLVAVIMLASLPAILQNSDCLMMPSAPREELLARGEERSPVHRSSPLQAHPRGPCRRGSQHSSPYHTTPGISAGWNQRRLPRPAQVDKLRVGFAANARGSSLRGRCHDAPPLRLPLVPRWPGVFLHSVRGLLHECTWLCLGHTRGNQGSG